ncbi:MAG: addiction module protein [Chloroflexota bacterium]
MMPTVEELMEQALALPSEARAHLVDLLVESLDAAQLGQVDRLWLAEAQRRRNEIRTGRVQTVAGDDALRMVRDSLDR